MGDMGMASAARTQARPQRQPIDIEQLLIWTYRDQKADRVISRGVGLHLQEAAMDGVERYASSTCGCAAVARIQELGVRVDAVGRDTGALHPDAEVVHRAVMQLTARVQGRPGWQLIISNAAWGERPDELVLACPRPLPERNRSNGTCKVVWFTKAFDSGYCPIEWAPSATAILQAQEQYQAWHRLLLTLTNALQREPLLGFYPLAPAAPATPWL